MSSELESPESLWHFDMHQDAGSSDSNPADYEPIPNIRNEYYPKYFIDELRTSTTVLKRTFDTESQAVG